MGNSEILISQGQVGAGIGIGILGIGGHDKSREIGSGLDTAVIGSVDSIGVSMAGNQNAHIHAVEDGSPIRKDVLKIGLGHKGNVGNDDTLVVLLPSTFEIDLLQPTGLLYAIGLVVDGICNILIIVGIATTAVQNDGIDIAQEELVVALAGALVGLYFANIAIHPLVDSLVPTVLDTLGIAL